MGCAPYLRVSLLLLSLQHFVNSAVSKRGATALLHVEWCCMSKLRCV